MYMLQKAFSIIVVFFAEICHSYDFEKRTLLLGTLGGAVVSPGALSFRFDKSRLPNLNGEPPRNKWWHANSARHKVEPFPRHGHISYTWRPEVCSRLFRALPPASQLGTSVDVLNSIYLTLDKTDVRYVRSVQESAKRIIFCWISTGNSLIFFITNGYKKKKCQCVSIARS